MNNFLVIFIDGVGIGKKDPINNPFFKYGFKTFEKFFRGIPYNEKQVLFGNRSYLFPSDPLLGIEGLPQSGTGQTSIFCGINAPKIIGKHFGPYPYSTLIPYIKEQNIFKYFKDNNYETAFANAYPKQFFDYINEGHKRLSVTTLSCILTDIKLNRYEELKSNKALSMEITNEKWKNNLNYDIPIIEPTLAAQNLLSLSQKNKFTLFEYFLTDYFGHGRYPDVVEHYHNILDEFLYYIMSNLDYDKTTLLICSDHGNFEDMSIKTHTLNPCLTISAGKYAKNLFENIKDISQIKQSITCLIE